MSDFKHSAEPWIICTDRRSDGSINLIHVIDANGFLVAQVALRDNGGDPYAKELPEAEANACLLRAAPKMLAALRAIGRAYGALTESDKFDNHFPWEYAPEGIKAAWREANAAVRTAKGLPVDFEGEL